MTAFWFSVAIVLGSVGQGAAAQAPAATATADAPRLPEGRRAALEIEGAALFVPAAWRPTQGGAVNVLVHLHGSPSVLEPAVVGSGWPGVLVAFNRKGLSRAYAAPFSDPKLFPRLLESARSKLVELKLAERPRIGRVVVSSFSAGFGGVREILKTPENFARIDGLIMADSLYCGYVRDPKERRLDPALMDGFRRFAIEAAAGRKALLVTCSALVPEGYASTAETAADLVGAVDGAFTSKEIDWGGGWIQARVFERGRLLVLGFEGAGGADHLKHLRRIEQIWKRYRALIPARSASE